LKVEKIGFIKTETEIILKFFFTLMTVKQKKK